MRERGPGEGLRAWRRAQLAGRWHILLTALVLGVALPIVAGIPAPDRSIRGDSGEIGVAIVMTAGAAGLLLAMASLVGQRRREIVLAGVALSITAAHPAVDFVFGPVGDTPLTLVRAGLGAVAAVVAARYGTVDGSRTARAARMLVVAAATIAIGMHAVGQMAAADGLEPAAALLLALTCLSGGVLAHVRGARTADGGLLAVGVLTASAGLGTATLLVGGSTSPTLGGLILAISGVVLASGAAFMALLDALERHDQARDAYRLARSLDIARLEALARRNAEVAHDQRTALLAIEAAAERLSSEPTGALAAAVAAEASRLQRMIGGIDQGPRRIDIGGVIRPVCVCAEALVGPIEVDVPPDTTGWGRVDETAEIVQSLIDNAAAHGAGPIAVRVLTDDDWVRVRVIDHGPGVPDALREVIFDRGVSSDPAAHSGLGLHAARRLAHGSGGDLRLLDGPGTTFELLIPRRRPVIDLTDDAAPAPRSEAVDA